jgi:hypothetical protein
VYGIVERNITSAACKGLSSGYVGKKTSCVYLTYLFLPEDPLKSD